jgi:polyisoprenoid-binding protein YceI
LGIFSSQTFAQLSLSKTPFPMKKLIVFFVFGFIVSQSWAQKANFKISEIFPIETSHSYVGFSVKYMGYAMLRGRFAEFQGSIRYVDSDITKTSASFSLNVNSIDTDNENRDQDLKSENWFAAEKFPKIYFTSTKAEKTAQGFALTGDLTIRGVSKLVTIAMNPPSGIVSDIRGDSQLIFTGGLLINRIDFGVEGKNWSKVKEGMTAVSNDVNIELTILGKQINESNFRNRLNPSTSQGKIYAVMKSNGVEEGLKNFETLRTTAEANVNERTLNAVAYMLLKESKTTEALAIFKKNMEVFPDKAFVYDSYAEGLAQSNNWPEALKYYGMALEKDPENMNAKEVLRHLK